MMMMLLLGNIEFYFCSGVKQGFLGTVIISRSMISISKRGQRTCRELLLFLHWKVSLIEIKTVGVSSTPFKTSRPAQAKGCIAKSPEWSSSFFNHSLTIGSLLVLVFLTTTWVSTTTPLPGLCWSEMWKSSEEETTCWAAGTPRLRKLLADPRSPPSGCGVLSLLVLCPLREETPESDSWTESRPSSGPRPRRRRVSL